MSLSGQAKQPKAGSTSLLTTLQDLLPVCGADFLVEGHFPEMRSQGSTQKPKLIVDPMIEPWLSF